MGRISWMRRKRNTTTAIITTTKWRSWKLLVLAVMALYALIDIVKVLLTGSCSTLLRLHSFQVVFRSFPFFSIFLYFLAYFLLLLSLSLSLSLIFLLIFPLTGDELEMIFLARAGCNYEAVVGRFGWLIRVTWRHRDGTRWKMMVDRLIEAL